jgi:hypothetical protein
MTQGAVGSKMPTLPVEHLAHLVGTGACFAVGGVVAGAAVTLVMRRRGWSWIWGLALVVAAPFVWLFGWRLGVGYSAFALGAAGIGACWHLADLRAGGDLAQRARDRIGPITPIRRWYGWRKLGTGEWVTSEGVVIGFSRQGEMVRVPIAGWRAVMSLLLGATGSGKTVVEVLVALAAIKCGVGVVYIDPKGDDFVLEQLRAAAARAGRQFRVWDPQGDTIYNPYHRGSNTDIADKLLAAEIFTEPHYQRLAQHYQRLAQRYIGHVIRALRLAGVPVTLATVVEHMHNGHLAALTRKMTPTDARPLLAYLETLTAQQERDLAGPATGSRSLPSQTSVICWIPKPAEFKSISASH